jgi:hypothetical protein
MDQPNVTQKPKRGLPIRLADGNQYYFSSLRMGPVGEPIRLALRKYSALILDVLKLKEEFAKRQESMTVEYMEELESKSNVLEDKKELLFRELCRLALIENYGEEESSKIADTLLTPEVISPVLSVIKTGEYPENFTQAPS